MKNKKIQKIKKILIIKKNLKQRKKMIENIFFFFSFRQLIQSLVTFLI